MIVREDLVTEEKPGTPTMLRYKTHVGRGFLYNTPPCWPIYISGSWCWSGSKRHRRAGGHEAGQRGRRQILYDFLIRATSF